MMDERIIAKVAGAFDEHYGDQELTGEFALRVAYSADFLVECAGVDSCTYAELAEACRRHNKARGHCTKWCDHLQSGNARHSDFNNPQPWVTLGIYADESRKVALNGMVDSWT